ncbi:MAG: HD domain-containing protein [Candidatus Korobacteraceae bacterium]
MNLKENDDNFLYLTARFTQAVEYARILHIEPRKGTEIPYIAHLLGVASMVMGEAGYVEFPITEDMILAALLHDAVEDHGGSPRLKHIEVNFGSKVAEVVAALSDSFAENSHEKEPWDIRKKAYVEKLSNESPEVLLISAADKLYNARAILSDYRLLGPELWRRFKRGCKDQLWYFDALIAAYRSKGTNRIVEELAQVINELRSETERERSLSESG